jgi:GNAT superfamily N-acetyltransferase
MAALPVASARVAPPAAISPRTRRAAPSSSRRGGRLRVRADASDADAKSKPAPAPYVPGQMMREENAKKEEAEGKGGKEADFKKAFAYIPPEGFPEQNRLIPKGLRVRLGAGTVEIVDEDAIERKRQAAKAAAEGEGRPGSYVVEENFQTSDKQNVVIAAMNEEDCVDATKLIMSLFFKVRPIDYLAKDRLEAEQSERVFNGLKEGVIEADDRLLVVAKIGGRLVGVAEVSLPGGKRFGAELLQPRAPDDFPYVRCASHRAVRRAGRSPRVLVRAARAVPRGRASPSRRVSPPRRVPRFQRPTSSPFNERHAPLTRPFERLAPTLPRTRSDVAVAPPARGKGIGRALLNACERAMVRQGLEKIYLHVKVDNEEGQALFEKSGYEEPADAKAGLTQFQISQRASKGGVFSKLGLVDAGHMLMTKELKAEEYA